ncbi:MAG: DegT/DnrJ/EryC1/StrS family aminotransferase [Patescibacteria group bacterium]
MARPHLAGREEEYVLRVLRSGILSIGPFIEKFEKTFAKKMGTRYACAVSSGTAGLHLALIAAGIKEGDEVITSPFSFIASANAILYVRAKPVFVDVDSMTGNIDAGKIEAAITRKTRAILPVHIFGQPAQMDVIMKTAKKHKLRVIEDACESLDATYRGKKAGTFGDAGVFAFYPNKQMTTGEGGMIVTNDKRIDELCRSLRNQGRAPNMQWLDHKYLGYNYRLDEMSAAVGLAQMENITLLIKKRQQLAKWYGEELQRISSRVEIPHTAPHATHTWFVYVIRIKNSRVRRDVVIESLAKKGVHTKPYLPSIHLFSFYKELFGYKKGDYPISEGISSSVLALPFYIGLTRQDVKSIVEVLDATLQHHERIQK